MCIVFLAMYTFVIVSMRTNNRAGNFFFTIYFWLCLSGIIIKTVIFFDFLFEAETTHAAAINVQVYMGAIQVLRNADGGGWV